MIFAVNFAFADVYENFVGIFAVFKRLRYFASVFLPLKENVGEEIRGGFLLFKSRPVTARKGRLYRLLIFFLTFL